MTPDQRERYSRQIRFQAIGDTGQEALLKARVGIVGCGALGSTQAALLARAGVGHLTLIDRDYVEITNLQRQLLYDKKDAREGLPKAAAAANAISNFASDSHVTAVVEDLTPSNIEDLLSDVDLILDGTDNFETRYLMNDFSVRNAKPWIYGAAVGSYGLTMPIVPGETACLACVYPTPPAGAQPTCETAGVLGPATSTIASLQTALAMRMLTGNTVGPATITTVDVWTGKIRQIPSPERNASCRACGQHNFIWLEQKKRAPVSLCGRNAVQIHERNRPLDLRALRDSLGSVGEVRANEFALRFVTGPYELTIFPDGRAIIRGTQDIGIARSLYSRYIGS